MPKIWIARKKVAALSELPLIESSNSHRVYDEEKNCLKCGWQEQRLLICLSHLNDVCSGDPEAEPEVVAVTMGN